MNILLTFAVEAEFAPWRRLQRFTRVGSGSQVAFEANFAARREGLPRAGAEIRVLLTGIGARPAERLRELLRGENPDICIAAGLAGGLRAEHRTGEILAARAVRTCENVRPMASDPSLLDYAVACGAKPVDFFLTSDVTLRRAADKARFGALADAVDMESHRVLTEMAARGVPVVAVRAVCDTVSEDLPLDFDGAIGEDGRVSLAKIMVQLLARPQRIPALVRLSSQARAAAGRLAEFLEAYVPALVAEKAAGRALVEVAAR